MNDPYEEQDYDNGYEEPNNYQQHYRRPPLISRRVLVGLLLCLSTATLVLFAAFAITGGRNQAVPATYDMINAQVTRRKPISVPMPWGLVRSDVITGLNNAKDAASKYTSEEIDKWIRELKIRTDTQFVPEYTAYGTQNVLAYKSACHSIRRLFDGSQPTVETVLEDETAMMFRRSVLREPIAQLRAEQITSEALATYLRVAGEHIERVPANYDLPRPLWQAYIAGASQTIRAAGVSRKIPLLLKAGTVATVGTGVAVAVPTINLGKAIVSKMFGRTVARQAAGKAASGTLGRFAGPATLVILGWDIADHHMTARKMRPVLRESVGDFLDAMALSVEEEIMQAIRKVEIQIIAELPRQSKSNTKEKEEVYADRAEKSHKSIRSTVGHRQGGEADESSVGADSSGKESVRRGD